MASAEGPDNHILKERQHHLLIIGPPRSGTTLLISIVGRHSEVALLNEDDGWAMTRIMSKKVVGNKRCVPNQIELKKKRSGVFGVKLFRRLAFADEYPRSKYSIEDYLRLPNMKIIGLVRNGNDVISSIIRRGKRSFRTASYMWCRAVEIMHELKKKHPDKLLVVSFEDVVLNPERNIKRIVSFLGLEFQSEMLEGYKYNWYYPETELNRDKVNRY